LREIIYAAWNWQMLYLYDFALAVLNLLKLWIEHG